MSENELEPMLDEFESEDAGMSVAPEGAASGGPAHKQLYQFLWGGIAVLFGCLTPFHDKAVGWDSSVFNPELTGPVGLMTVSGSIAAFVAVLFIGAQLYSIKFRKVMLGPLVLMLFVCIWGWASLVGGFSASGLGGGDSSWFALFYDFGYFQDYFRHVGPGYLFVTLGSTYVVVVFAGAIAGLGKGKKSSGGASGGGGKTRSRGRRR